MRHISAWTWWRNTIDGLPTVHSGEKNGTPFQISTIASHGP
jgi:hypothetical protein